MSTAHHATECVFEVEPGWVDTTRYLYECGDVRVLSEPFGRGDAGRRRIDEALEKFRHSVPGYSVLERSPWDRPVAGAELVVHRMGGGLDLVEVSLFWPIDDVLWVFRASAPTDQERRCRDVVEHFARTYQPTEAP